MELIDQITERLQKDAEHVKFWVIACISLIQHEGRQVLAIALLWHNTVAFKAFPWNQEH